MLFKPPVGYTFGRFCLWGVCCSDHLRLRDGTAGKLCKKTAGSLQIRPVEQGGFTSKRRRAKKALIGMGIPIEGNGGLHRYGAVFALSEAISLMTKAQPSHALGAYLKCKITDINIHV